MFELDFRINAKIGISTFCVFKPTLMCKFIKPNNLKAYNFYSIDFM